MSPIKRYLGWFENLSPNDRSAIALGVGSMLVSVTEGQKFAQDPSLVAGRGAQEEADLALSLVGITNIHIAETPMKERLEDIGQMRERAIEDARRQGDLATVQMLEKAAETAPLRDKRMEKMAADWIAMRDRNLTVAGVRAWLTSTQRP
jgi:hypothetical protein